MKLNSLNTDGFTKRRWCGPSALAMITGRTLKYCHNKLARIKGVEPRYLKGVSNGNMRKALDQMGYEMVNINIPLRAGARTMHMPTLKKYIMEEQPSRDWRSVLLINVTDHYVIAQHGKIADNSCPDPIDVIAHHSANKRIYLAWQIKRKSK
jgi:hypothetical protein